MPTSPEARSLAHARSLGSAGTHIYTAPLWEAVRIVDDTFDPPMVFELAPRSLVRCGRCRRRRWAAKCIGQAYYDGVRFWCRDARACKKVRVRR